MQFKIIGTPVDWASFKSEATVTNYSLQLFYSTTWANSLFMYFQLFSESDPSDDSSTKLEEKTNAENLQNSGSLPAVSLGIL